jgi:RND family efflux transporter MFP subunit
MRKSSIAVLVVAVFAPGCTQPPAAAPPAKPPEVLVGLPIRKEVVDYEEFTGRTEAMAAVEVRARATGYLEKVNFREGAAVKEGDMLFEIDDRLYRAELNRAEQTIVQNEARTKRLEQDALRERSLRNTNAGAQSDYDKVMGDLAEAQATVGWAKANRDLAKLNLSFTKVTAPLSGTIGRRLVDPGNLVKADETPLATIVTLDPMYVFLAIDERTVLKYQRMVREGKLKSAQESAVPVELGLADESDYPLKGKIDFVDNRIDPATGTLRLRGTFANLGGLIAPGQFVRARLQIGARYAAILVAERALGTDQGKKFVYTINENDEVMYRPVKIGRLEDGLRVIEDGLTDNARVVISGLQRIRPGAKVEARMVDMPLGGAPPVVQESGVGGQESGVRKSAVGDRKSEVRSHEAEAQTKKAQ